MSRTGRLPEELTMHPRQHIAIIGGNFAGLTAAVRLSSRHAVTVIDPSAHFEWMPNIHELPVEREDRSKPALGPSGHRRTSGASLLAGPGDRTPSGPAPAADRRRPGTQLRRLHRRRRRTLEQPRRSRRGAPRAAVSQHRRRLGDRTAAEHSGAAGKASAHRDRRWRHCRHRGAR